MATSVHFQLATDQNGNSIQNVRALQILCITRQPRRAGRRPRLVEGLEPTAIRAFEHAGRRAVRRRSPRCGTAATSTSKARREDAGDFVQYLIDNDSFCPSATATRCPAMRKPSLSPSAWAAHSARRRRGRTARPCSSDKPTRLTPSDSPSTATGRAGRTRTPSGTAAWTTACHYQLHAGVCQSGDFMNMGNIDVAWEAMTKLDFFTDINLWFCPNNGNADVIFPCYHWLEVDTTRVSQGAGGFFGCGCAAVEAPGECIYDPDWNVGMYKAIRRAMNHTKDSQPGVEILNFGEKTDYRWPNRSRVLQGNVDAWKTAEIPRQLRGS